MLGELEVTAQAVIDGPWRQAAAAVEACRTNAWPAFVRVSAPPSPWLLGAIGYRQCIARAAKTFAGPRETTAELIPVWVCDTEDASSEEWYAAHAQRLDGGQLDIIEPAPYSGDAPHRLDARVVCSVEVWQVGLVVANRDYAPGVRMLAQYGDYSVFERPIVRVTAARAIAGAALDRPPLSVPMYCNWVEPRVDGLATELVAELRALSVTTDEEGNLIPRPPTSR